MFLTNRQRTPVIVASLIILMSGLVLVYLIFQRIGADQKVGQRASPISSPVVSGVGVRLIHNSAIIDTTSFTSGISDPEIKFASLHIPLIVALAPNQTREQLIRNPQFNYQLVSEFITTWRSQRRDVELNLVVNGLGAKNANSKSLTHDGPLPKALLDWLGPADTITYLALELDTLQPITRRLPNPCSSRFIGWYKRLIANAATRLDGNPDLASVMFATGLNAGTSLGSPDLVEKFRTMGCTGQKFGEATKSILRQTSQSFTLTPLILGLGELTDADGAEADRLVIRELLELSLNRLGFDGVETHTLSGNVKKMNKKITYQEITTFIRNYPKIKFTRIDGVDDPLYCTNIDNVGFSNEEVNQSCGPRLERKLGDYLSVTQVALNKLSGISPNSQFPRQAVKLYKLDVDAHERPQGLVSDEEYKAIDVMFKTLNTELAKTL